MSGASSTSRITTRWVTRACWVSDPATTRSCARRAYTLSQPSLRYFPLESVATLYYRAERNPETAGSNPFNVDRFGFSIQQERQLRNRYVWNYGYRFEQARTYDPRPGGLLDVTLERRASDEHTDARDARRRARCEPWCIHLPRLLVFARVPWIGYPVREVLWAVLQVRPLEPPKRERFTNEILRSRFVYAAGVRVGLAPGLGGQELPLSERFFAGGSTTLRGFAQNAVGPIGADGIPLAGKPC